MSDNINHLHIDIETFSATDIKSSGAYKYMEDIEFEILLVAFAFNSEPVEIVDLVQGEQLPQRFVDAMADSSVRKHAHNANFERQAFLKVGIHTEPSEWYCSAIKAAYCGYPLQLAKVSEAMELEEMGKLATGKALIKYFCAPCKPTKVNGGRTRNLPEHHMEKWEEFKRYCINDVVAEREVENRLEAYTIPDFERENYIIDQEINDRGIQIDDAFARNAIKFDEIYSATLRERMKELTGVENPNSPAQLKAWLGEAMGEEITTLAKDEIPLLIERAEGEVVEVLKLRQKMAKSSIKKYIAMLNCLCDDNKAHGLFQFYGASRTGRFAGRLIQLQNLPQNHIEDLDTARGFVADGDYEVMSMVYDDVSSILSQLIRTAFVAPERHMFAVADFSAIEARVIAWLAQEQWRLDVFKGDGKIYEASASMMFGVPLEEVTKGSDYRAKGKISELALGYQGAKGALSQMGGEAMGLSENEMDTIVRKWRKASPAIVALWKDLETKAIRAVSTGKETRCDVANVSFKYDGHLLQMILPSGRALSYVKPTLTINRFEKRSLKYMGVNDKKQWTWIDTYGGKLAENCLGANTLVLTDSGWKQLISISTADQVWDGVEWVKHEGLIYKGDSETIKINGVDITPDHLILTTNGWQNASSCQGLNRAEIPQYRDGGIRRLKWAEIFMVSSVRLWKRIQNGCFGVFKEEAKIMRLQEGVFDLRESAESWKVGSAHILGMEVDESSMHTTKPSSMEKLRRSRHNRMQTVVRKLREFYRRYGVDVQKGTNLRAEERERELRTEQLQVGDNEEPSSEQKRQRENTDTVGQNNSSRSFGKIRSQRDDNTLSNKGRGFGEFTVESAGCEKPVYDLKNAGPRHRFLVKSLGSRPFIAHNCTQAIARDLLTGTMKKLRDDKLPLVMHVHDETVCDVPADEAQATLDHMVDIMSQVPDWAEGLPLTGDGYITPFYKKD